MHRQIVYVGAIPQDTDLLLQSRHDMIGLGMLAQSLLGTSTYFTGLACTPTSPASMTVNVAPGCIYSQQVVDATAFGSLAANTTQNIVKQGNVLDSTPFALTAPTTTGQSQVFLIEAAYQDIDSGDTVLPYYNASNPSMAYSGPNNTGVSQKTVRKGVCTLQVKAGTAATTGSQTTPAPDAGFIGLYTITIANGQTTITSGNIQQLATAPFIGQTLTQIVPFIQSGKANYAVDTSATVNLITASLVPAVTGPVAGMPIFVKIANTNTSQTVNLSLNGSANVPVINPDGTLPAPGQLVANGIYEFVYDGTKYQMSSTTSKKRSLTANTNYYVATTGNDTTGDGSSGLPWATIQHAVDYISSMVDISGYTCTVNVATGTYAPFTVLKPFIGGVPLFLGNTTTPSNVLISSSTSGLSSIGANGLGIQFSIAGFKFTTSNNANAITAQSGALISVIGNIEMGSVNGSNAGHFVTQAGGNIIINSNYTISGGAQAHYYGNFGGQFGLANNVAASVTGSPNFGSAFLSLQNLSVFGGVNITYPGSSGVTGLRFNIGTNSVCNTQGGGANYFPGNATGTYASGGIYA